MSLMKGESLAINLIPAVIPVIKNIRLYTMNVMYYQNTSREY